MRALTAQSPGAYISINQVASEFHNNTVNQLPKS